MPNSLRLYEVMARRCLGVLVLLLAVAFAEDNDDAKAAAAADHLRAGELRDLLTKAGVDFACAHLLTHCASLLLSRYRDCAGTARRRRTW